MQVANLGTVVSWRFFRVSRKEARFNMKKMRIWSPVLVKE